MAIQDTYSELLIEEILKEILLEGGNPSAAEITNRFEEFTTNNNISKPLFIANNYKVDFGQTSSSSLFNETNNSILRDFKVLYKHLFKVSDRTIDHFSRWRTEAKLLETRLNDLEERINSLLLISNDTAGFLNFIQDNFVDTSKIDLPNTNALVNVDKGVISIGTVNSGVTRLDLSDLRDEDIDFTVLSRNNLIGPPVPAPGSKTLYVVTDQTNYWQERVYTSRPGPVSIELKIDLKKEYDLSRIDVDLHQSNTNSTVQLTPLLSTDNFNYTQLPIPSFTRSVLDKSTFQFPSTKARYVKFLLSKTGFDVLNKDQYSYEFGIDEIAFYNEAFLPTDSGETLISKPLFVRNQEGNPEAFGKLVLETCENIPQGTSISYGIAVSNDPEVPLTTTAFIPISPLQRTTAVYPVILDFGDLEPLTIEDIGISYNALADTSEFINPSQSFNIIQSAVGSGILVASGLSSQSRYLFLKSNHRLLDHSINKDIKIAEGTLEIWRNVNTIGENVEVRGIQAGWGFNEPYFTTTVYVDNPAGVDIDFGGKTIVIDGSAKSGKVNIAQGRHSINVHKDNWSEITNQSVNNITDLKEVDNLYPYNHRYLIEGYQYPESYLSTDEKIYRGFDIVAEYFMKEISIFDLNDNIAADDYQKYSLDTDAADENGKINGIETEIPINKVVLLKVNENNPDFVNEKFLIKFKSASSTYKYLRLKAILKTENANITPFLDSYRIKITS